MSILLRLAGSMTAGMSRTIQEEEQASLEGILTVVDFLCGGMGVVVTDFEIFV